MPKRIEVDFRDELVSSTLRRRAVFDCPKCALLNLHERMADLRFALKHARSARLAPELIFREMLGVISGGV